MLGKKVLLSDASNAAPFVKRTYTPYFWYACIFSPALVQTQLRTYCIHEYWETITRVTHCLTPEQSKYTGWKFIKEKMADGSTNSDCDQQRSLWILFGNSAWVGSYEFRTENDCVQSRPNPLIHNGHAPHHDKVDSVRQTADIQGRFHVLHKTYCAKDRFVYLPHWHWLKRSWLVGSGEPCFQGRPILYFMNHYAFTLFPTAGLCLIMSYYFKFLNQLTLFLPHPIIKSTNPKSEPPKNRPRLPPISPRRQVQSHRRYSLSYVKAKESKARWMTHSESPSVPM